MNLEGYDADGICQSMGLPAFIEASWRRRDEPAVRVVLAPSFHPELCITLVSSEQSFRMTVVALRRLMLETSGDIHPPSDRADVSISASQFHGVVESFRVGHRLFDRSKKYIFIDGLRAYACLVSRSEELMLDSHGYEAECGPSDLSLSKLVDLAWQNCSSPRVRNALADAGGYLGMKCPREEVEPEHPVVRLAVLGSPEARREYFEQLRRAKDGKAPSS